MYLVCDIKAKGRNSSIKSKSLQVGVVAVAMHSGSLTRIGRENSRRKKRQRLPSQLFRLAGYAIPHRHAIPHGHWLNSHDNAPASQCRYISVR